MDAARPGARVTIDGARIITRRADAHPSCFRGPDNRPLHPEHAHRVEPNARGWFEVTSARSGKVYRVGLDGSCTCEGFRYALHCSHVAAVLLHAEAVLGKGRK